MVNLCLWGKSIIMGLQGLWISNDANLATLFTNFVDKIYTVPAVQEIAYDPKGKI